MTNAFGILFIDFICHLYNPLWGVDCEIFCSNFIGFFSLIDSSESFIYSRHKLLLDICFAAIFSQAVTCFSFSWQFLWRAQVLFWWCPIYYYFCVACSLSEKALAYPRSQRVSPIFSWRWFYSFSSYALVDDPFKFHFLYSGKVLFLCKDIWFFPAPFIEESLYFFPLNYLGTIVRQLTELVLDQWLSTESHFAHPRDTGNVWRHFCSL